MERYALVKKFREIFTHSEYVVFTDRLREEYNCAPIDYYQEVTPNDWVSSAFVWPDNEIDFYINKNMLWIRTLNETTSADR